MFSSYLFSKYSLQVEEIDSNMELSHSLTLNEEAFKQIPDHKKPVFVFEWLRFLDKILVAAQKVEQILPIFNENIIISLPI